MANEHIPIGLIKTAFASEHYPNLFSGNETDDPAFRIIGQLVHYTNDAALIKNVIISGLPKNYDGNTIEQLDDKIERTLAKDWHLEEPSKKKKLSKADMLMKIIEQTENLTFIHDKGNQPYMVVPNDNGGNITLSLQSKQSHRWLKKLYYDQTGSPIPSQSFSEVLATLEAKAIYDGQQCDIFLRLARVGDTIYLNLGDKNGTVITINTEGYAIVTKAPVYFLWSETMAELPKPEEKDRNFNALLELQKILDLDDKTFHRVMAFIISCFKPEGPYLCFITEGEQGSGKSFLNSALKKIIDPSTALKLRLPREERELMIIAKQFYLLVFDNITGIKNDISDALCTLSTGGGFATRKLFTDEDLKVFNECRPYILNGISGITHRPDLLDRSISVHLKSMPAEKRKTEHELNSKLDEIAPQLLHKLLCITSHALKKYDQVETPRNIRMVDAAKWLIAAEPATGLPEGSLLNALETSQEEIIKETMERNSLAVALNKLLEKQSVFDGTIGELLSRIEQDKPRYDSHFPTTASYLSKELNRIKPALKVAGIIVEFGPKKKHGKTLKLWFAEDGSLEEASQNMMENGSENAISF